MPLQATQEPGRMGIHPRKPVQTHRPDSYGSHRARLLPPATPRGNLHQHAKTGPPEPLQADLQAGAEVEGLGYGNAQQDFEAEGESKVSDEISSREIGRHLLRYSQLLDAIATRHLVLEEISNPENPAGQRILNESRAVYTLGQRFYDAKTSIDLSK